MSNANVAKLEGINKVLRFNSIFYAVGMFLFLLRVNGALGHSMVTFWLPWIIIGLPKIFAMLKGGMGAAITGPLKADYEVVTVDGMGRTISSDGGAQSMQMNFIVKLIMIGVLCVIGGLITIIHVFVLSIKYIITAVSTKAKSSVIPNGFIIILINIAVFIGGSLIGITIRDIKGDALVASNRAELGVTTSGDYDIRKNKANNGIIIYEYKGKGGSVTIPNTFGGLPVVAVDGSAFSSTKGKGLTSIVIPEGVTDIANGAFSYCENLTSVTLPQSIQRVGSTAFGYCASLTEVKTPQGRTISYGSHVDFLLNHQSGDLIQAIDKYFVETQGNDPYTGQNTFKNCTSLSAASKQAITASGYTGEF